jgi:hypothetical protein
MYLPAELQCQTSTHRARQRRAVLVEHADAQARELAERALRATAGEVARIFLRYRRQPVREVARTRQLGRAVRPAQQRLRRPAARGLGVARLDPLRPGCADRADRSRWPIG